MLLQHFGRMLDALAPRHVGDVDQAVDVVFHFHERAKLGEVPDLALDLRAHRILFGQVVPRVARFDLWICEVYVVAGKIDDILRLGIEFCCNFLDGVVCLPFINNTVDRRNCKFQSWRQGVRIIVRNCSFTGIEDALHLDIEAFCNCR